MPFAIAYTKPGTMLTFWLNNFWAGGHIWSLVRSTNDNSAQRWSQPPLRFETKAAGEAFIATELAGNELAFVTEVLD